MEIRAALEATAESDDAALSKYMSPPAVSSDRRVSQVRNIILRFLQNVPEDATAIELRQAIEDAD